MTCPLCHSEAGQAPHLVAGNYYEISREIFTYWRCSACACLYLHPRLDDAALAQYYTIGPGFIKRYNLPEYLFKRFFSLDEYRILRQAAPVGETALDYGSGDGFFALLFKQRYQMASLDLSSASGPLLQENGIAVLESLEGVRERFGLIYALGVIEHVQDPDAMMRELHQALKPGGVLFVTTPNTDSWQFRLFGARCYALLAPQHLQLFNQKNLRHYLERHGFAILGQKKAFMRSESINLLQSLSRYLDPVYITARVRSPLVKLLLSLLCVLLAVLLLAPSLAVSSVFKGPTMGFLCRKIG